MLSSRKYIPPPDRSLEVYSILTRRLPPEIAIEILNSSGFYHRTHFRRLQTVFSACGQSKRSREDKRKTYLEVPVRTFRTVRKLIWVIRMPDVRRNDWTSPQYRAKLKPGDDIPFLEVSLHRPSPSGLHVEIHRSWLSFVIPSSSQTKYVTTWTSSHELIRKIQNGDKIRLVLPAVYGDDRTTGGEIWEAVLFLFTDW
jgi:hypothetical protein